MMTLVAYELEYASLDGVFSQPIKNSKLVLLGSSEVLTADIMQHVAVGDNVKITLEVACMLKDKVLQLNSMSE